MANEQKESVDRQPYTRPELTQLGTVEEITRGTTSGGTDLLGLRSASDRSLKENVAPIGMRTILERLIALPIYTWNYKSDDPSIRHIGPMAQDFAAAFGVGKDDRFIHTVDAFGVAFAAIQALHEILEKQEDEIRHLRTEVDDLRKRTGVSPEGTGIYRAA